MPDSLPPQDDALLAMLGAFHHRDDPPPRRIREGGLLAYGFRDPDARLAELLADTADAPEPAGVRGAGSRSITCRAGDDYLEVGLIDGGDHVDLVGLLAPAREALVTLERPSAEALESQVDADGRFGFQAVARGTLRLRIGGPTAFATPWITA